jgi:peptidoglycan hydrolase-like protein with peptidoglycan-binding domain
MRILAAALLVLGSIPFAVSPTFAQTGKPHAAKPAKPAGARAQAGKARREPPTRNTYVSMPASERIAIQSDLIWTGDFNGLANGDFGERAVAAVKAFQKRHGGRESGVLTPPERSALATSARAKQEVVGWRVVNDEATGIRLGLPSRLVPQVARNPNGSRWRSAHGEIQVESFRVNAPGATLANVYERERKEPSGRQIEYNVLRPDFFVVSGMQGLKKFYVRAGTDGQDVRGIRILYDQATEGIMDPVAVAMSSAFTPFPTAEQLAAGAPLRRKVDYASGLFVSAAGDILTDRAAVEDCRIIVAAGFGHADLVADEEATGLALLRVYGARGIEPLALAADDARTADFALVGIADPKSQAGGDAVSSVAARLSGPSGSTFAILPAPAPGFSGAAAIAGNRVVGMVHAGTAVVAGPPEGGAASIVPAEAIRRFLARQKVATAASGAAGPDDLKGSIVRVICVRD